MATTILGYEESVVVSRGSHAEVPDHDICRLSYYLKSGTRSFREKVIAAELVDYTNAHRLPKHSQDLIFRLAYGDFNLKALGNVTIIVDEDYKLLPRGNSMIFSDVKKASKFFAIQSHVQIARKRTRVYKFIMLCNKRWLEKYYFQPLHRYGCRLNTLPIVAGLALAGEHLTQNTNHCDHCRGHEGRCACTEGCLIKAESLCDVVHHQIRCNECQSQSIQGTRYQREDCSNYNLCVNCYSSGKHSTTHTFLRIARVGSTPVRWKTREQDIFITDASTAIPILTMEALIGISDSFVFSKGQAYRLVGLADATNKNGQTAVVIRELADGHVIVCLPNCGTEMVVTSEHLAAFSTIAIGHLVKLTGLTAATTETFNGKVAEVVSINSGHVQVKVLDENNVVVNVKADNLQVLDEVVNVGNPVPHDSIVPFIQGSSTSSSESNNNNDALGESAMTVVVRIGILAVLFDLLKWLYGSK